MKLIGIQANTSKQEALICAFQILKILQKANINIIIEQSTAAYMKLDHYCGTFEKCDMIIVIGGDGTILQTAKNIHELDVPIFGVNVGHVGFLTETNPKNVEQAISQIIELNYFIDKREMLCANYNDQNFYALNDFNFFKVENTHLIKINVFVDNIHVERFCCDGLIVSSSTGSTAYSLSAGGPIVHPDVQAIIITPICAHTLRARPIIVSSNSTITIEVDEHNANKIQVCSDGNAIVDEFDPTKKIHIFSNCNNIKFVRLKKYDFFGLLNQKLL